MGESIDEIIDRKIRERVDAALDERFAALRPLFVKEAVADMPDEYGDALDVARLMGLKAETEAEKKSARNKVYYLAGIKAIPCVRISPKKMRFPLGRIKEILARGGLVA